MRTNLNVQISVFYKRVELYPFFFILYIEHNKSLANFIVLAGIVNSFQINSRYKL